MYTLKHTIISGICALVVGYGIGNLYPLNESFAKKSPVSIDFCFLLQNPELIGSRRFLTVANILPARPHRSVLEGDSCPAKSIPFEEKLDSQDFKAELARKFHDDPYGAVSVSFEGSLYWPNALRRLWFRVISKFGFADDRTPPITIRAYKAVGKPGGEDSLKSLKDDDASRSFP